VSNSLFDDRDRVTHTAEVQDTSVFDVAAGLAQLREGGWMERSRRPP
jgi:hypothetical protein